MDEVGNAFQHEGRILRFWIEEMKDVVFAFCHNQIGIFARLL
jgi:hypothetical protein